MTRVSVLFTTSIVSPHLLPFVRSLTSMPQVSSCYYAATDDIPKWREAMGWEDQGNGVQLLRATNGPDEMEAEKWWRDADIVLCCVRDIRRLRARLAMGKLTFFISERWWRPPYGLLRLAHPKFAKMAYAFRQLSKSPRFHYLAIGHYAASDMAKWACFGARQWLWSYFTDAPPHAPTERGPQDVLRIIYVGRLLRLKNVDLAMRAAKPLCANGTATLSVIGDGPERSALEALGSRLGISGSVQFEGSMSMPEIWSRMRKSHVLVLASDEEEGWGAVVNEAMVSGCCVVASRASGAGATMIQHEQNGLVFDHRSPAELENALSSLVVEAYRLRLAKSGFLASQDLWSSDCAAARMLHVCERLLKGANVKHYRQGPMAASA